MRHVVPQRNDRLINAAVFVAENAQRRGAEKKMLRLDHWQSDPVRAQHATKMPVREKCDVSLQRTKARQEPVGARGNLRGRFSAGTTVAEEIPTRLPLVDFRGRQAFIVAVVPLRQVRLQPGGGAETGEFAGPARSLARTREHVAEIDAAKTLEQLARVLFAFFGQQQICSPGVPA